MGRMSWGASSDLSGSFAFLYNQFIGDQTSLALRSERRAQEAQAAADSDAVQRWQDGAMSDEEFRAYATQRVSETAAGDEPELTTYWANVLRDFETSVLSDRISLEAGQIQDDITEGSATWQQLLDYYKTQRASLDPASPLYKQLTEQIGKVTDQVRQSRINGEFEKVDYLFRNNSISGAEAGRQMRALADRYFKVNDPEQYYKTLQAATQYEVYTGLYNAGRGTSGGGSGGGGGGGSGTARASLSRSLEFLLSDNAIYRSLIDQAEAGAEIGLYDYVDASGELVQGEVPLRTGPGGQLIPQTYEWLVDSALDNYDQLITGYTESCQRGKSSDCSNMGTWANNKRDFIVNVQSLNTEDDRIKDTLLQREFSDALERVENSPDPELAWGDVRQAAADYANWQERLNAEFENVRVGGLQPTEPDTATPETDRAVRQLSPEDQVAAAFFVSTSKTAEGMRLIATGDPASILRAKEILDWPQLGEAGASAVQRLIGSEDEPGLALRAASMATGEATGAWQWTYVPGERPRLAQVRNKPVPITQPDGSVVLQNRLVLLDPQGREVGTSENSVPIMLQVGDRWVQAWTPLQTSYQSQNPDGTWVPIDQTQYQAELNAHANWLANTRPNKGSEPLLPRQAQMVQMQDANGIQHLYFLGANGLWHRDGIKTRGDEEIGGIPIVAVGPDRKGAQALANQLGLDPSGALYLTAGRGRTPGYMGQVRGDDDDEASAYRNSVRGERTRMLAERHVAEVAGRARSGLESLIPGGRAIPDVLSRLVQQARQLGLRSYQEQPVVQRPRIAPSSYLAPAPVPAPTLRVGGLQPIEPGAITLPPPIKAPTYVPPKLPTYQPASYLAPPTVTTAPTRVGGLQPTERY
jgi:hypothetical protein